MKKTKDLNLWRKESHSSRNLRVVSTPWWSLPQCSKPLLTNWRKISIRSLDEISQCLCSLISVKIQGLIRAPLWKNKIHGSFEEVKTKNRKVQKNRIIFERKTNPHHVLVLILITVIWLMHSPAFLAALSQYSRDSKDCQ